LLIRDRNGGATAVLRQLGVSADAVEEALRPCVAAALPRIDPEALATLGIDFQAVRERLEEKFGPGALEHTRSGCLGVTPGTKQALPYALAHADGQPLGDERILLSACSPFPTRSPPRSSASWASPSTRPRRSSRAAMSNSTRDGAALRALVGGCGASPPVPAADTRTPSPRLEPPCSRGRAADDEEAQVLLASADKTG
jgi:hypothetical protein